MIMFKFILIKDVIPLAGLMVTELGKNISEAPLNKREVFNIQILRNHNKNVYRK